MATKLAHTKTGDELLRELHVEPDRGLSTQQVDDNQRKYGKNGASHLAYLFPCECALTSPVSPPPP